MTLYKEDFVKLEENNRLWYCENEYRDIPALYSNKNIVWKIGKLIPVFDIDATNEVIGDELKFICAKCYEALPSKEASK